MTVKVMKVNPDNPSEVVLTEAESILASGGAIVYPTDTIYGLGADPFNRNAVKNIFKIKKRDYSKGLPLLIDRMDRLFDLALSVNEKVIEIVKNLWPGPLTVVVYKSRNVSSLVTGGSDTVALRLPRSKISVELARLCGGAIIGTSANISGSKILPLKVKNVLSELEGVDLALDGGELKATSPSTIVDLTGDKPIIIREGALKREVLENYF